MGFFDGIGGVDPSGASPRFPPDIDAIIRVHDVRVNQGQWGTRYIVEADVLQSNNPSCGEGSRHSWTVRIDGDYGKMGLGEVKSFVAACKGLDPNDTARVNAEVTPAVVDSTLNTGGNTLRGSVVRTQTTGKTTKTGNDITKHIWLVVDPNEAAMLVQSAPAMTAPAAPAAAPTPPPPVTASPPSPPPAPAASAPFPPPGWTAHPTSPGFYYKGQEVLSEAQLKQRSAAGTA